MKLIQIIPRLVAATVFAAAIHTSRTSAAEARKPTISVAATESQVPSWQPAMGQGLAQMMITELSKLPNLQVVESVALDDLREERSLGETGEVERSERIKRGSWKGAEYSFKTTITRFGAKDSNFGGSGLVRINGLPGGFNIRKSENEVQIDWRIVDTTTRAVVKSGRGTGKEKGSSFSFGSWGDHGFSNNREFMDSALGKATMKAIACIVTELETWTPPMQSGHQAVAGAINTTRDDAERAKKDLQKRVKGEVLLVEPGKVWVSLGSEKGFEKGEKLKVYKRIEKKNKSGTFVTTDYQAVADIEITKVQKDKSCASYGDGAVIDEGWAVALASLDINELE